MSLYQKFFNFIRFVPKQRFWPQCESCAVLQSVSGEGQCAAHLALGHAKIALGIGFFIGLRHFYPLKDDRLNPNLDGVLGNRGSTGQRAEK